MSLGDDLRLLKETTGWSVEERHAAALRVHGALSAVLSLSSPELPRGYFLDVDDFGVDTLCLPPEVADASYEEQVDRLAADIAEGLVEEILLALDEETEGIKSRGTWPAERFEARREMIAAFRKDAGL